MHAYKWYDQTAKHQIRPCFHSHIQQSITPPFSRWKRSSVSLSHFSHCKWSCPCELPADWVCLQAWGLGKATFFSLLFLLYPQQLSRDCLLPNKDQDPTGEVMSLTAVSWVMVFWLCSSQAPSGSPCSTVVGQGRHMPGQSKHMASAVSAGVFCWQNHPLMHSEPCHLITLIHALFC